MNLKVRVKDIEIEYKTKRMNIQGNDLMILIKNLVDLQKEEDEK